MNAAVFDTQANTQGGVGGEEGLNTLSQIIYLVTKDYKARQRILISI